MRLAILHVPGCPNVAVLADRLHDLLAGRPDVAVEYHLVQDEAEAAATGMAGSPTLLIDGVDPFAAAGAVPSLSCRLYRDETGAISGAPSPAQLRAVLAAGTGPSADTDAS